MTIIAAPTLMIIKLKWDLLLPPCVTMATQVGAQLRELIIPSTCSFNRPCGCPPTARTVHVPIPETGKHGCNVTQEGSILTHSLCALTISSKQTCIYDKGHTFVIIPLRCLLGRRYKDNKSEQKY